MVVGEFPSFLLSSCESHQEFREISRRLARRWWVAHVKPRQEKKLAAELHGRVCYYLPLAVSRRIYRGRRVQSTSALFPGYVFLFVSESERLQALKTNRIVHLLPVERGDELFVDLMRIKMVIDSQRDVASEKRLAPGQAVRVISGALEGLEGVVQRSHGKERLAVHVRFLSQSAVMEATDLSFEAIH